MANLLVYGVAVFLVVMVTIPYVNRSRAKREARTRRVNEHLYNLNRRVKRRD